MSAPKVFVNNHIKVSRYMGGQSNVWEVSASLRRAIQQAQ